jgi:hypothetical protein
MKKLIIVLLLAFTATAALESCSSKICPAYNSYPKARRG